MPEIPVRTSDRSIPGASGSPNMPMSDPIGEALQRAGGQIGSTANNFLEVDDRIARAQRQVDAAKYETTMKEWSAKKLEGLKGRSDYENFDALMDTDTEEINTIIGGIEDQELRLAVERGAQTVIQQHRNAIRVKKAAAIVDTGKAELDKNLSSDIQEWVPALPEERKIIRDRMESRIMAMAQAGVLTQKEAVDGVQGIDAKLEGAYAAELMNTDPLRLKKELEAGGLTHIDPEKRQALIKATEGKAIKQTATTLLIDLKEKYPDMQERIKHIESVEFLKSLGDEGAEIQNTLLSYTLREWKTQEDAYKTVADDKIGKASVKIYNRQELTDADLAGLRPPELAIVERVRDYQVRQDRAEQRMATAEKRDALRDAKIAKQETSDAIAGQIVAKIISGEPIDLTTDIYAKIPSGLDGSKANQLASMAGKLTDPGYKLGLDVLKKAIPDKAEYGRAVLYFQAQVENDKAKGNQILTIAETIAKPKKTSMVGEWLNRMRFDVKMRMQSDSFTNAGVGKTEVIDGKTYKDGDIIIKDGKKMRVRIQ